MKTIEGLTIRCEPWTAAAVMNHLWQSSLVGAAILVLLLVARRASARTRRIIAWIGLIKFVLPFVWYNPTVSHLNIPSMDRWSFTPTSYATSEGATHLLSPVSVAGHPLMGNVPWPPVLVCIWAAGAMVLLSVWGIRGLLFRRRLLAAAVPVSPMITGKLERASARVGLDKPPRCIAINGTMGPGVLGVFSPVVVLPRALDASLTDAELDPVLLHELIHVKRRDTLLSGIQAVAVRLFWFNPVVWLLDHALNVEMEKSCDEAVIEITEEANVYAESILKIVRHSLGAQEPGFAGAMGIPIVARVRNILERAAAPHRRRPMLTVIAAAFALVAFSGFSGAIRVNTSASAPVGKALVVRDAEQRKRIPAFESALGDMGYEPSTIRSGDMETTDFSQFSLIVIPSGQGRTEFQADYAKAEDRFDRFVRSGGTLLLEVKGDESKGILRQYFKAIPAQP